MGFNYQQEKNKFLAAWVHTVQRYRQAGMSCGQINEMYDIEWQLFKQQRNVIEHTVPLLQWDDGDAEAQSDIVAKILSSEDRYFETVSSDMDILLNNLKPNLADRLTMSDKQMLHLLCQGYSQKETGQMLGIKQQTVCRHIKKIKKYLREGC